MLAFINLNHTSLGKKLRDISEAAGKCAKQELIHQMGSLAQDAARWVGQDGTTPTHAKLQLQLSHDIWDLTFDQAMAAIAILAKRASSARRSGHWTPRQYR